MAVRALQCSKCRSQDVYVVRTWWTRGTRRAVSKLKGVVSCFPCGKQWMTISQALRTLPTTAERRETARLDTLKQAHGQRQGRPGDSHD